MKFYNKRGTAEQWIKEGKYALNWTRLSCHDFTDNQVRLQLFALAYNLGNFLRRLALPKSVKQWSLRTLRDKLIKIGAKVVSHSRYVIFQMAEVAVPRILFREILDRIRQLRFLTISARPGWCVELLKIGLKEWRSTAAVCQNIGGKWVLGVCARLFGGFQHDMLEFSRQIWYSIRKEAQRRSWAKICNVIWEIPAKGTCFRPRQICRSILHLSLNVCTFDFFRIWQWSEKSRII